MVKNQAESIRQRLRNLAKVRKEEFNFVLRQFVLQRLMYRLSISVYADDFMLKGGLLFWVWNKNFHRPTQDMDLLAFGDDDIDVMKEKFSHIMQIEVNDGVVFKNKDILVSQIKEDAKYQGIRISGKAYLTQAVIPYQIDIGFGDAVEVERQFTEIPSFLEDLPTPKLKVYPVYTVIAEKFHAMIVLGKANSRMKDFYDLLTIAQTMSLTLGELQQAIKATFDRRGLTIADSSLIIFTDMFKNDEDKNKQWNAFKRKNGLSLTDDFAESIDKIQRFLEPVYQHIIQDTPPLRKQWNNKKWRWEDTIRE